VSAAGPGGAHGASAAEQALGSAGATRAATGALLEVRDLAYSYGERKAVDGLSFEVRRGEIFGLLGPNGAGKTTAIGCLCGLLRPAAGQLRFDGQPFEPSRHPSQRARLGVVPQELALYDGLTARENLRFFGGLYGVADLGVEVERGIELAGLVARADDRVKTFSGGMKRRLNLAAALLADPALLLLDEPMVGVDPQSRHHILESIERQADDGRAVLYTSHAMDEVQRLCDRLAIVDHGRLVGTGSASQLASQAGLAGADLEQTFLALTGHSLRDGASA